MHHHLPPACVWNPSEKINDHMYVLILNIFCTHQQMTQTVWEKKNIYKCISRANIKHGVRLHFLRRYKLYNWKDFNGIELQGQRPDLLIGWGERKPKRRERGDRQTERHRGTSMREWDLKQEVVIPFWLRWRNGEMSCSYLCKTSCQVYRNTVGTSRRCMGMLELHVFFLVNVMNNFCSLKMLKFLSVHVFVTLGIKFLLALWSFMVVLKTVSRIMLNAQMTTLVAVINP